MDNAIELQIQRENSENMDPKMEAKYIMQTQQLMNMKDTHGSQLEKLSRNKVIDFCLNFF